MSSLYCFIENSGVIWLVSYIKGEIYGVYYSKNIRWLS